MSWRDKRWLINGLAVLVVAISAALFVVFSPQITIQKVELQGEGCARTDNTDHSCKISFGEKELVLRECNQEENCNQSKYVLGKREANIQYILYTSEVFAQSIQVSKIDLDTMQQEVVDQAFYTEITSECSQDNAIYSENCFAIPTSEAQRKDIWEQNQKYQELEKEYKQ